MLDKIFMQILNMSFTAGFVIVFVLIARLALKKAPKVFSYALWSVALFRLLCPFSIESMFSFLPVKTNVLTSEVLLMQAPKVDTGITAVNNIINSILPVPEKYSSINPLQILFFIGSAIWLFGVLIMALHSAVNLAQLAKKLKGAWLYKDNIYISKDIPTAFVVGVFKPKIYLPDKLNEVQRRHILLHEQTHIKRFDHCVKILSFIALCLHWFNPLAWLAFFKSSKDMEMSCDESVIKSLGNDVKQNYSASLLSLSSGRHIIGGTPLTFGEGDTKARIKNVLNYKKPAFWVIIVAVIVVTSLCAGLLLNPVKKQKSNGSATSIEFPAYSQRTEYNAEIFDIQPFYLYINLPDGWSVKQKSENDIKYPLMGAWSPLGIYNEKNEYIGAVGYNIYEDYEGSEEVPQAIYNQIALGNGYKFNAQSTPMEKDGTGYTPVIETSEGVTAITEVYIADYLRDEYGYDKNRDYDKGILSYNKSLHTWIAIELDSEKVSEQQQLEMARSIKISQLSQAVNLNNSMDNINMIDKEIREAILQSNKNEYHPVDASYTAFTVLSSEVKASASSPNNPYEVTVFLSVLQEDFNFVNGKIDPENSAGGSNTPTAITFKIDENNVKTLKEYWLPRDGSYYKLDIEEKFPQAIWEDAKNTQKYIGKHKQNIYKQIADDKLLAE